LGKDQKQWSQYDACRLISKAERPIPTFVDQGEADEFLTEQLKPKALEVAAKASGYPLTLRCHPGYDHSYYFIATFVEEHLRFHAHHLGL
jgi:S-formylglutathione hydrolase